MGAACGGAGMALCGGNPLLRSAPRRGAERASRTTRRAEGESGTARGDGWRWARRAGGGNGLVRRQPSVKIGPAARRGEGEPDNAARGGGKRDCARAAAPTDGGRGGLRGRVD